jgi:hypothetical protein
VFCPAGLWNCPVTAGQGLCSNPAQISTSNNNVTKQQKPANQICSCFINQQHLLMVFIPADCPAKAGYTTMSSINWDNTGGLREGRADSAAAAEAFCNQNKHCSAFNDSAYWMLTPPASFASFYPYQSLCTYLKNGKCTARGTKQHVHGFAIRMQ